MQHQNAANCTRDPSFLIVWDHGSVADLNDGDMMIMVATVCGHSNASIEVPFESVFYGEYSRNRSTLALFKCDFMIETPRARLQRRDGAPMQGEPSRLSGAYWNPESSYEVTFFFFCFLCRSTLFFLFCLCNCWVLLPFLLSPFTPPFPRLFFPSWTKYHFLYFCL